MSVNEKMTAIADAIRGKTGGTEPLTLDQMATEIAGIQVGGGGAALLYATEFSVSEVPESKTTLAVIETGLTLDDGAYTIVIKCVNDTLEDTSNHFKWRKQLAQLGSGYVDVNQNSGFILSDNHLQNGSQVVAWVTAAGRYMKTITVTVSPGSNSYGYLPTGDYRLEVYKTVLDIYGLEGM